MKKLALALMFCCGAAYGQGSEWVARLPNNAGGTIVFLTITGSCQTGKAVYGSAASGNTAWGCWINSENHVLVFWNEGQTRTSAYPYGVLEINPVYLKKGSGNSF